MDRKIIVWIKIDVWNLKIRSHKWIWISQISTVKSVNFHWFISEKKYFSLSNQSIFTEIISEIWLIYSNLFLAILISQISLIISRFWPIAGRKFCKNDKISNFENERFVIHDSTHNSHLKEQFISSEKAAISEKFYYLNPF